MKLVLKNICSIKKAELIFNGITVLAGENNTGKSTISRALYSVFYGLYQINDKIIEKIKSMLVEKMRLFGFRALHLEHQGEILQQLIDLRNRLFYYNYRKEQIINDVRELINKFFFVDKNKSDYDDYQEMISYIVNVLVNDDLYYKKLILNDCINSEFKNKISSVFSNEKQSRIEVYFNNDIERNVVELDNNKVIKVDNSTNIVHNILYLDGQDVDYYLQLNDNENFSLNHRYVMDNMLQFFSENDEIYDNSFINNMFIDFNGVGRVYVDKNKTYYKTDYFSEPINPSQISQGLKSVLILRQLFYNNYIKNKTFIILDEPEINLHPKWQLHLAKLLCDMNKNMNIHILLCSHSPYFITAINEYSIKCGIAGNCTYYISKKDEVSHINSIIDLTNNPKDIFTTLYEPIITLREING